MSETPSTRKRGNSKPNVKRRGSTYTYYLYVVGPDGRRRQHSKGGFKTQREAEVARVAAAHALATGAYVKAERISFADFLVEEWLPSRRPPVLEESTWHSYERYLRLHVIPHVGAIPLQKLSPVDLNQLYRRLLAEGRHQPGPRPGRSQSVARRAAELRADGLTYERVAEELRAEFDDEATITKNAVAAILRREATEKRPSDWSPGLSPRTVRYIHTIIHAALKEALRWSRVVRNVADATTPPSAAAARSHRPWRGPPSTSAPSSTSPPRAHICRRGSSWPRAAADAASASVSAGATPTSTMARRSSRAK